MATGMTRNEQSERIAHEEKVLTGQALTLRISDTLLVPLEVLVARYALAIAATVVLMLLAYMGWRMNRILTIYAQEMMYRRISAAWLKRQHSQGRQND